MREVARRLGVEIQFFAHGGDGLYEALDVGQVDVLAGQVVIDPRRMGLYRYSAPYYDAGQVLVVPAGASAVDLASLAGGRVAVELGSEGDALARRAQAADQLALVHTDAPAPALDAVAAGAADAAIVDRLSAQEVLRERSGFAILLTPVTSEPYALVTRFSSPELARRLQEALRAMQADGTLETLYRKWLP
jgi:polar amino acid transport system substrate-binding protein